MEDDEDNEDNGVQGSDCEHDDVQEGYELVEDGALEAGQGADAEMYEAYSDDDVMIIDQPASRFAHHAVVSQVEIANSCY